MRDYNLKTGDWVKLSSIHNSITVPVAEMSSLNENTVWTWNAIGKEKGLGHLIQMHQKPQKVF